VIINHKLFRVAFSDVSKPKILKQKLSTNATQFKYEALQD